MAAARVVDSAPKLDSEQESRELINSIRQFVSEAEGDKKH